MISSYHLAQGKRNIKFTKTGSFVDELSITFILYQDSLNVGVAIEDKWVGQFENDLNNPNEAYKWNFVKLNFECKKLSLEEWSEISERINSRLKKKSDMGGNKNFLKKESSKVVNHNSHFDHYYLSNLGQFNANQGGLFFNQKMELEIEGYRADFYMGRELSENEYNVINPDQYFPEWIEFDKNPYYIIAKYTAKDNSVIIDGNRYYLLEKVIRPTHFIRRKLEDKYQNVKELEQDGNIYILFEDSKGRRYAILRYELRKFEEDLTSFSEDFWWTPVHPKYGSKNVNFAGIEYSLYRQYKYNLKFRDSLSSDSLRSDFTGEPDIDRNIQNGDWHEDML